MDKIVRIHASPYHSPIETAFNLTLTLTAPYSERIVTIIINGNITDYQEAIKQEGFEISQLIMTEGTHESAKNTFDLDGNSGFALKTGSEFYEVRLINIGKDNSLGQDFLYFEFEVKNRSQEKIALNIQKEGSAVAWFDPRKNPLTFTEDKHINWGQFQIEGNDVLVLSKGQVLGVIMNPINGPFLSLFETIIEKDFEKKHMMAITWTPELLKIYHNDQLKLTIDPKNLN